MDVLVEFGFKVHRGLEAERAPEAFHGGVVIAVAPAASAVGSAPFRELMESQRPGGKFPGYAPYGLRHGLNRPAILVDQGDTPGLFNASNRVFNQQPGIIPIIPNPQPANRLLAPVRDFCESDKVRRTLNMLTCATTWGCIRFMAIEVTQIVAQREV